MAAPGRKHLTDARDVGMDLKDLLAKHSIDPLHVLVLRHTPTTVRLKRIFPWLADQEPAVFNAYQQTHQEDVEREMKTATYVASFIGDAPSRALFVGFYRRHGQELRTPDQIRAVHEIAALESYGVPPETKSRLWFDLRLVEDFFPHWKGKLSIQWPGREINWHRRADRAEFQIICIHEESRLAKQAPDSYREWDLQWDELRLLPESWKSKLREWRGIYFIFDASDGRGYVGSASGAQNLLGRWQNYADGGDGGNVKLLNRDPMNFRFSILEVVPPDMERDEVNRREQNWKNRLHTCTLTHGLNLPELDH